MWRVLVTTWIAYGCGHPVLEGYRPAIFDRPLQSFHENVNAAAQEGKKGLASLSEGPIRFLKGYITRVDAQLRPDSR
jgi:Protein of unknown function (DUF962)